MNPNDDTLSRLLRTWRVAPTRDPAFRGAVWDRITATQTDPLARFAWLFRPAVAFSCLLLAALLGAGLGLAPTPAQRAADLDRQARAYAVSIDPILLASAHPHSR